MPSSALAQTTAQERLVFGVRHGLYGFPTDELCDFLKSRIRGRRAIEIGAGHGVLGAHLGIPATDNWQQEEPALKAHYAALRQPTVPYGPNVEKLDALWAMRKYEPQVVLACWVTHLFDPSCPEAGGSVSGVDEGVIIESCDDYIFIGNEQVHRSKPIWSRPHEKLSPPWLFSRAINGSPEFLAIFHGKSSRRVQ